MKTKTIWLVAIALMIGVNAFGQVTKEELMTMYQDTYERALQYNDRFEAKSVMYRAIALDPQNDSLKNTLAYLYADAGQYASTVLVTLEVLANRPNDLEALELNGYAYENLGLREKALDSYDKLYVLTSDFQILYKMAFMQLELGKLQQALTNADIMLEAPEAKELTVFFKEGEEDVEYSIIVAILNLKGLIFTEMGDKEQARKSFQEALAISPEFSIAKEGLAALDE